MLANINYLKRERLILHAQFGQHFNIYKSSKWFNFLQDGSDDADGKCVVFCTKDSGQWRKTKCDKTQISGKRLIGVLCQKLPGSPHF